MSMSRKSRDCHLYRTACYVESGAHVKGVIALRRIPRAIRALCFLSTSMTSGTKSFHRLQYISAPAGAFISDDL